MSKQTELAKRNRTLERRVERLLASGKERDAELLELKWHLGWVVDYLNREKSKQIILPPLAQTALDHAYKARNVGRSS